MITGPELRKRRQAIGVSARKLGKRARVSQPCITEYEQGKHQPHPRNLEDITDSLIAFEREKAQHIA